MTVGSVLGLIILVLSMIVYPKLPGADASSAGQTANQTAQSTAVETVLDSSEETVVDSSEETELDNGENTEQNVIEEAVDKAIEESSKEPSKSTVDTDASSIPDFFGEDYYFINDNVPNFNEYDLKYIEGENYSPLDELGRCQVAYAMLDKSLMPTGKRNKISEIKPSGWKQKQYPGIITDTDPPYLYNRSHLIAYALAGEDLNELNLITGTRHFNAETMLPYEEEVMRYIKKTNNHVLYRITPYFVGNELVARGVEMEAYSVEDEGKGVSYHVFVYNYQPGVTIDYQTGKNWLSD